MDEYKTREKTLQDQRFSANGGSRGTVDRAYDITSESHELFRRQLTSTPAGKRMLEIGSGAGANVLELSSTGAMVTGIDLSDVAVELARSRAATENIKNVAFAAMDAEYMDFPDNSFDVVCGGAILHHLKLDRAYPQIARVMASGGYGLFLEPLGYNPVINLYRRFTPKLRTPDEHPLLDADLRLARRYFGSISLRYFYLTTLLLLPLASKSIGKRLIPLANAVDRVLFKALPFIRKYAWIVIIELRDPVKNFASQEVRSA